MIQSLHVWPSNVLVDVQSCTCTFVFSSKAQVSLSLKVNFHCSAHICVKKKKVTKILHIQASLINDLSEIYMSWIQNYSQKVTCTRHKQTFQTMSCLIRFVHFWNLGLVCFFSYSVTSCFKLLLHLFGMFRNTWMKLRKIKNVTLKSSKFINNLNSTRHS